MLVTKIFRGKTRWQGDVEVFDLAGHFKAKRAYGWSHPEHADGTGERFVAVLEIPPVDSPPTAVKISIVSGIKAGKLNPVCFFDFKLRHYQPSGSNARWLFF